MMNNVKNLILLSPEVNNIVSLCFIWGNWIIFGPNFFILGNKLSTSHVHYERQKMRVYLAAQVLSNSVADALEYCHAKVPGWETVDTSGTCKFLRVFNMLFDRMNSKNPFGKFLKSPLNTANKEQILEDFTAGEAFILSLAMHPSTDSTEEPQRKKIKSESLVICGPRKKGFLGFLVNMQTYKKLYIQTGHLRYILTYKTSQDHVEHLFSCIRGSLGKNRVCTKFCIKNFHK